MDPNIDLLLLTALIEEQQVVHAVLRRCAKALGEYGTGQKRVTLYEYSDGAGGSAYVLATACRHAMGAVPMSSFATALFTSGIRPACAVLVGIAATLKPEEMDLGDLPVASDIFSADDIAVERGKGTFRPRGFPADPAMRNAAGRICEAAEKHARWGEHCRSLIRDVVTELNEGRLRPRPIVLPASIEVPRMLLSVGAGGPFLIRDEHVGKALRTGSAGAERRAARTPEDGTNEGRSRENDFLEPTNHSSDANRTHEPAQMSGSTSAAHDAKESQLGAIELNPLHPKLEWYEMEAHGFMEAAHEELVPAIVMKGISDAGDEEKAKLEKESGGFYRAYACSNAVVGLLHLLERGPRQPIPLNKRLGGTGLREDQDRRLLHNRSADAESPAEPPPDEVLEIPLDSQLRFAGTLTDAEHLILRVDAAIAAKETVMIKLVVPGESELRSKSAAKGSPEAQVTAATAKLALAALNKQRHKLDSLLRFFLVDSRFRVAFVPHRDQAARCLVSLINDPGEKHGADGFTKIGLFIEREPSVGTSVMLRTEELTEPARTDGCKSVAAYKEKLMAFRSDTLMALPLHVRIELAYPAIIREIVFLKEGGHLKDEWLRPTAWAFGLD